MQSWVHIKGLLKSLHPQLLQLATHVLYLPSHVLFTFIFIQLIHMEKAAVSLWRDFTNCEVGKIVWLPVTVSDGQPNSRKWLILGGISIGIQERLLNVQQR